nr:reverse transcriptase domain-containing protein [Tanacetum cinerariifolium]
FVVLDFEADPQVPLILRRSFLRTGRALIDVYREEITLRVNDEAVTFNPNQTTRYSSSYDDLSVNQIDIIDVAKEEYAQEILGMDQAGSGVAGPSSSKSGFHQSCIKFTLGIWSFLMSLSSDECTCSSRAESSSICRSSRINETDGLNLMTEVVQAVYSADTTVFDELGDVEPCD